MSHPETHSPADQAERTARDRLVDGLLRTHHELPLDRERRVAQAMAAVRQDARASGFGARRLRQAGGLAAVAAVIAAAFVFTPSPVSAADRARATMLGERAVQDRRVMFLLNPPAFDSDRPSLTGTLDVRDARHMVLTLRRPDGALEIRGLDGDRAWRIDASGQVHDEPADHPWPVWIQSPRGGLLVDIAETIETGLAPGWTWSVTRDASGADRLVASRQGGPRAEPQHLVASIDPQTGRVKRLEIEWPTAAAPQGEGPSPRGDRPPRRPMEGEGAGEPPMRAHGPGGPPPMPRAGRGGPPPRGEGAGPEPRTQGGADRPPPPLGAPSSMVILPEPPVAFPEGWFSAQTHLSKVSP